MKKATGALILSSMIVAAVAATSAVQAASRASRKPASSTEDVPLFRHVHDCNVELNPILAYVGLGTMTTMKIGGETHAANLVPAPPLKHNGRAGFYVLSDRNQAIFIDVPVIADEATQWKESGAFSKRLAAVTHDRNFYQDDALNGRFEVAVNLSCTADFDFKDPDGTPNRRLIESDGTTVAGGIAVPGTCNNRPDPGQGVKEIPQDRKLDTGRLDRNVAGPEVDKAAIEDLHARLSTAMDRIIQNINAPARFAAEHPEANGAANVGTQGVEARKNACHLVKGFFEHYNACAAQFLSGAGGLSEIAQNDPEFSKRLSELGKLYASFREPSDSAECKPPISGTVGEQGGQATKASF